MSDATCRIEGCDKPRRRNPSRTLCAMHNTRVRRHGSPDADHRRVAAGRRINSDGYVMITVDVNHPLVPNQGRRPNPYVYQHRVVLFDAIGHGPHPCRYCGTIIWWMPTDGQSRLTVDHVDRDRTNNDPANLVPACQPCNTARGTRSHCQRGHALTPENIIPGTKRRCVTCDLDKRHWITRR